MIARTCTPATRPLRAAASPWLRALGLACVVASAFATTEARATDATLGEEAATSIPAGLARAVQVAAAELRAERTLPLRLEPTRRVERPSSVERDMLDRLYRSHPGPRLASGVWPSARMRELVDVLAAVGEHALDPVELGAPALQQAMAAADSVAVRLFGALAEAGEDLTVLEGALAATADSTATTEARLALAIARLEQRLAPRGAKITGAWLAERVEQAFSDPAAWQQALFPSHFEYRALLSVLPRYRELVARGGFTDWTLEQRLRWDRWLPESDAPATPDAIEQALRAYQRAHAIEPTGQMDKRTEKALAVPAHERLRSLLLAVERWQGSPTRSLPTYIRVNIPAYTAEIWRDGALLSERLAIVGTNGGQTDRLDRAITRVQVNPPWWVPPGVKRHDLDKRAELNPAFYKENGFRKFIAADGEERVTMPPGPDNWLGRVIFRWRGGGNIYIHDTPFKERFEAARRQFSHGCVNLERAVELGRDLVVTDGVATAEEYDARLASLKTTFFDLKTPVPAFLEYVTAVADEEGRVGFKPDIYGHDRAEGRHIQVAVPPDTAQN